jgi:hypothetical protein
VVVPVVLVPVVLVPVVVVPVVVVPVVVVPVVVVPVVVVPVVVVPVVVVPVVPLPPTASSVLVRAPCSRIPNELPVEGRDTLTAGLRGGCCAKPDTPPAGRFFLSFPLSAAIGIPFIDGVSSNEQPLRQLR